MVVVEGFITLRIYKVLKQGRLCFTQYGGFITLRIYKVLKHTSLELNQYECFITLRIYKVLKPQRRLNAVINS